VRLDLRVDRVAFGLTTLGTALSAAVSVHTAINARVVRRASPDAPHMPPLGSGGERISILVPARNEALRIGPTIAALLRTDGVPDLEFIVLDDHSTDNTVEVVHTVCEGDSRVRIVNGEPLPDGWMGKPWACDQLGRLATGSVLVFVDADVTVEPSAVRASVELLRAHSLSLVSPYPRQLVGSLGERIVQPLLQWLWLSFLPLRLAERPTPVSMAAANGQLLVVDAADWRAVGGHGSVRAKVIEDVELAKAFKAAGYRAVVAEGSEVVSCRMYSNWNELADGYSKSLWATMPSRNGAKAVGAIFGLMYVVPPAAAIIGLAARRPKLGAMGLLGYVAGVYGRITSARRTKGSVGDSLFHPVSVLSLLWLGSRSWRQRTAGSLTWKGRTVP
jgi:GT2 family glycosyltransferase